jgi:hypothetical protein
LLRLGVAFTRTLVAGKDSRDPSPLIRSVADLQFNGAAVTVGQRGRGALGRPCVQSCSSVIKKSATAGPLPPSYGHSHLTSPFPFSLRRRTSLDGGRPCFLGLKLTEEAGCYDTGRLPETVLTKASLLSGRQVKINLTVSIILCCMRYHTLSLEQPSNTDKMKAMLSVVFSLVVGSVVYMFSRLYKVRKEMEQLVRDYRLYCPVRKRYAN